MTYTGGGSTARTTRYQYVSQYFHPIEFEFDAAAGISGVTSINTGDHPTRPSGLPLEAISLETVYRRAGFDVTKSGGDSVVPLAGAGADAVWSNQEMHDAMQVYWSRFAPKAQWSVWVFFAALHEQGASLGGIMFDDIGPNQRQGTAIFERRVHRPGAGRRQRARCVGAADALLDRGARDGPHVQSRALVAEVARHDVDSADRRAERAAAT